jgi:hypothetical protein
MERIDAAFATALEREIMRRLQGDGVKDHGLYRALILSTPETFIRNQANVLVYEEVLKMMREVARRLYDEPLEPERAVVSVPSPRTN